MPDIEKRILRIEESFNAIMPESRLSKSEKIQRTLISVQKLVKPIVKMAVGFVMNTGISYDKISSSFGGMADEVLKDSSIVDRTVTASSFKKLIKTESIQNLVKHHLSEQEILSIEKSM
jgi:hypothetical protein